MANQEDDFFFVTGGFFDGSPDGFVITLGLKSNNGSVSLEVIENQIIPMPDSELAVPNKSLTGGLVKGGILWVCSSNQILGLNRRSLKVERVINDPLFNDLHYVLPEESHLTVVNTGLESIDTLSYAGDLLDRTLLTSDARTSFRAAKDSCFRTTDSKPHFMHACHCSRTPERELLVTFVRQRRVVNLSNWQWVSPEYGAPPHEGFLQVHPGTSQLLLWATTVPGLICATDPISHETVHCWKLKDYGIPTGWTRGLTLLPHGILVGTTCIRETNHDYFRRWNSDEVSGSITGMHYIPFDGKGKPTSIAAFPSRPSKVFSIIPA